MKKFPKQDNIKKHLPIKNKQVLNIPQIIIKIIIINILYNFSYKLPNHILLLFNIFKLNIV